VKRPSVTPLLIAATVCASIWHGDAVADDWKVINRSAIPVQRELGFTTDPKAARLDFRAFDFSGYLLGDGTWQVSSPVTHRGLLCATYEVGVRFGVGSPGCTDVSWLSEPVYVGRQRQCNESTVDHVGGETMPRLGYQLPYITCVERVVRCSGNCK
jgi:hypothetical protein